MSKKEPKKADDNFFANNVLSWYPGHMAKTRKAIIDDLKLIDIVIEILDARIPISSRNPDIEDIIKNKKRIVILNKKDLADDGITKKWVEFFEKENTIAIPFEANKKNDINKIINSIKLECSDILNKYASKGRNGYSIKAMIFGIPNVGKSTFINCISKNSKAKVENRPGVTKEKQWIRISDNIELMDTPGMLWPKIQNDKVKLNLAFTNSISSGVIDNEEIAFQLLKFLIENYKSKIENRYGIKIDDFQKNRNSKREIEKNQNGTNSENKNIYDEEFNSEYDENEFILNIRNDIAIKKGCIMSGGKIDELKISNMILNDFRNGKIGKISLETPTNF